MHLEAVAVVETVAAEVVLAEKEEAGTVAESVAVVATQVTEGAENALEAEEETVVETAKVVSEIFLAVAVKREAAEAADAKAENVLATEGAALSFQFTIIKRQGPVKLTGPCRFISVYESVKKLCHKLKLLTLDIVYYDERRTARL